MLWTSAGCFTVSLFYSWPAEPNAAFETTGLIPGEKTEEARVLVTHQDPLDPGLNQISVWHQYGGAERGLNERIAVKPSKED